MTAAERNIRSFQLKLSRNRFTPALLRVRPELSRLTRGFRHTGHRYTNDQRCGRSARRGKDASFPAACFVRLQSARVRLERARSIRATLCERPEANRLPRNESRTVWDGADGRSVRRDRRGPRLVRNHGFDCPRTEISGQRLWRLFAERFGTADKFFADDFVVNYCPLAFVEASGCNRTPNKLPATERESLFHACDRHLRKVVAALEPEWLIGIGDFAAKRAQQIFVTGKPKIGRILHPSPASPAANRDWAASVTSELERLGVW